MRNCRIKQACLQGMVLCLAAILLSGCSNNSEGGFSISGLVGSLLQQQEGEMEEAQDRNYSLTAAEEKILVVKVETESDKMPETYISCTETSTAQKLSFHIYKTGPGYMTYIAEVPEGTWRVKTRVEGYSGMEYTEIEVTEDINLYIYSFEFDNSEDSEEEEETSSGESEEDAEVSEDADNTEASEDTKDVEDIWIPEDALSYDGHSYRAFDVDGVITWGQAKEQCESMGGHLVTISSQEEEDFLKDQIYQEGKDYWLGGLYSGDQWKWSTGEDMTFTAWSEEPSESDSKVYVYLGVAGDSWQCYNASGEWNDRSVVGYICEWDQERKDYVTSGQQITEEDMGVLLTSAEEVFYEHIDTSWSDGVENLRGLDYLGYYFLAPSGQTSGNRLYLVYKVNVELLMELSDGYLDEIVTYYMLISYDDLVFGEDGNLETENLSPTLTSHKYEISDTKYYFYYLGYETLEEAEEAVSSAAGSAYQVENDVKDIETDYEPNLLQESGSDGESGDDAE